MDTVRDLIEGSLRLCGALDPGEPADAEEVKDALGSLNDMLDAWRIEDLLVPYTLSNEFVTEAGKDTYTIGEGGDWNAVRPVDVDIANLRSGGVDYPLTKLTFRQYADIAVKNTVSTHPNSFYYEAQYPLGRFVLFPVPSIATTIVVGQGAELGGVTLDTDIGALPPGYRRAIRYNLALELAPEYSKKDVASTVIAIARDSKARIKSKNSASLEVSFDQRLPGQHTHFDYRIG